MVGYRPGWVSLVGHSLCTVCTPYSERLNIPNRVGQIGGNARVARGEGGWNIRCTGIEYVFRKHTSD